MTENELWDSGREFPAEEDLTFLQNVRFNSVHKGVAGKDQYLHESGLIAYKGRLYAAWVNNLENEADEDGHICGSFSLDQGRSWSPKRVLVSEIPGRERWEYASFAENNGKLWLFSTRCHSKWAFADPKLEAFVLNEFTGEWEAQGILIEGFVATDEPRKMENGRWIFSGMFQGENRYALSESGDFTKWSLHKIEHEQGLSWPNASFAIEGSRILAIIRNSNSKKALHAVSEDFGQTFSFARESNLPMAVAKPFAGILSNGVKYLIANVPLNGWEERDWLAIYLAPPRSFSFTGVAIIRGGGAPPIQWPGATKKPQWSYAKAVEMNGHLHVIYTVGKEDAEMATIPIPTLSAFLHAAPVGTL